LLAFILIGLKLFCSIIDASLPQLSWVGLFVNLTSLEFRTVALSTPRVWNRITTLNVVILLTRLVSHGHHFLADWKCHRFGGELGASKFVVISVYFSFASYGCAIHLEIGSKTIGGEHGVLQLVMIGLRAITTDKTAFVFILLGSKLKYIVSATFSFSFFDKQVVGRSNLVMFIVLNVRLCLFQIFALKMLRQLIELLWHNRNSILADN
jgi:hypothetical protein